MDCSQVIDVLMRVDDGGRCAYNDLLNMLMKQPESAPDIVYNKLRSLVFKTPDPPLGMIVCLIRGLKLTRIILPRLLKEARRVGQHRILRDLVRILKSQELRDEEHYALATLLFEDLVGTTRESIQVLCELAGADECSHIIADAMLKHILC